MEQTPTYELMRRPAPAILAGLVSEFVMYRETAAAPIAQTETASLVVPFMIGFAEPFEIALGRPPSGGDSYASFTSGLCLRPVRIRSPGTCCCLSVSLTPLGARRFFGLPMPELTERMVPLDDLGDRALARLRERLGQEDDWNRRLDIAEAFVIDRFARAAALPRETAFAYEAILASGGRMPVARIADRLGWSRKHLAARFREEIGLPPKQVSRVARFMEAQAMASRDGGTGWADIAAACGYADQAHLIREFQEFSGASPAAWLAAA